MICDIFIRSYWKDIAWLEFCLASIERHARGFRSLIVVIPHSSRPWIRRLAMLGDVRIETCPDYGDDYLGQQATKLSADTYTDADFICHIDSDCILARSICPNDLIPDGKPRIVMRPYSLLGRYWPWKEPTEAFLGWPVMYDFMQRPPFVYPRWIYEKLRTHAQAVHRMDLERYIMSRRPRDFSEFNVLGAFAYTRYRDRFIWIDDSVSDPGPMSCRWYWSWGGVDPTTRSDINALLGAEVAS